jgi:riboflavin biosynthesis pyrimidine reductase
MQIRSLYERTGLFGPPLILSDHLRSLYDGDLVFLDAAISRPFIIGNFVQTLDGIVSLKIPGHSGGGDISGRNEEDMFIMALLRAYADAVLVGEDTARVGHSHVWTADHIYPGLSEEFWRLRRTLKKPGPYPLNVVVSGTGTVDLQQAIFQRDDIPHLVLTTCQGEKRLRKKQGDTLPTQVRVLPGEALIDPTDMAALLYSEYGVQLLLHEGGPMLFSSFLEKSLVDELFLTIAPRIIGRGQSGERPNFSHNLAFDAEESMWGSLLSVKTCAAGHLFLRYGWRS